MVEHTCLASEAHSNPTEFLDSRTARFINVTRKALVLGSSQKGDLPDPALLAERDIELVVRKSGGGAVLLSPGNQLWVDISIPEGDVLFRQDVRKSFYPVGEVFQGALSAIGCTNLDMHIGGLEGGPVGRRICFAGLGPGELTHEGAKVVGISQRRVAGGAVFQCTLYVTYPHDLMTKIFPEGNLQPGYALGLTDIVEVLRNIGPHAVVSLIQERLVSALNDLA